MKILIYFLIIVLWSINMEAKVKLPPLLSDNMVLQQKSNVRIWGKATPNSTVVVTPSWANKEVKTHADEKGCWELQITTPAASFEEYTLTLTDGEQSVTLQHLLIGEVWLCAGQSNMVMPLNGFDYCPISDSNNVIADAPNHPGIRMVTIKPTVKLSPQEYAEGSWQQPTTENAPKFSAAAYHYALTLQRTLQIPIGVITCAWGGSRVEGWLPKEILQTYKDEDLTLIGSDKTPVYLQSMLMYNGILYPCHKYTIKGFIWYQGESNVRSSRTYAERLATMVKHWRSIWKQGDLPFYYVETVPFACEYKEDGYIGALLREAQQKALSLNGETIEISFSHAEKGLSPWMNISGFEIAGSDKVFYPAEASLNQKDHTVIVKSPTVKSPVAVRYCFRNFLKGNLINTRNLPVRPFRTDKW